MNILFSKLRVSFEVSVLHIATTWAQQGKIKNLLDKDTKTTQVKTKRLPLERLLFSFENTLKPLLLWDVSPFGRWNPTAKSKNQTVNTSFAKARRPWNYFTYTTIRCLSSLFAWEVFHVTPRYEELPAEGLAWFGNRIQSAARPCYTYEGMHSRTNSAVIFHHRTSITGIRREQRFQLELISRLRLRDCCSWWSAQISEGDFNKIQ